MEHSLLAHHHRVKAEITLDISPEGNLVLNSQSTYPLAHYIGGNEPKFSKTQLKNLNAGDVAQLAVLCSEDFTEVSALTKPGLREIFEAQESQQTYDHFTSMSAVLGINKSQIGSSVTRLREQYLASVVGERNTLKRNREIAEFQGMADERQSRTEAKQEEQEEKINTLTKILKQIQDTLGRVVEGKKAFLSALDERSTDTDTTATECHDEDKGSEGPPAKRKRLVKKAKKSNKGSQSDSDGGSVCSYASSSGDSLKSKFLDEPIVSSGDSEAEIWCN